MIDARRADELADALRALGAPCFLGGMARGLLGRNSPLHIRQNRRVALAQADVVSRIFYEGMVVFALLILLC